MEGFDECEERHELRKGQRDEKGAAFARIGEVTTVCGGKEKGIAALRQAEDGEREVE